MAALTGTMIGRYLVQEQIGSGGMAVVYRAYDTHLDRDVALKVLLPHFQQTDTFLKRFKHEVQALARLTHPNIVGVIDYGDYESMAFLVMEYVPGGSLRGHSGEPMPPGEALRWLLPVARALAAAHREGIVHCDVNPGNILVTTTNEPMLSDFGIARVLESGEVEKLTRTGMTIGTPEYMAPEQAAAEEVDPRTDVYALGIVLYELLTGRTPFKADTPAAVLHKQLNSPLPDPQQFVSNLPEEVVELVFKALAKEPQDRFESMEAFAAAMEHATQALQSVYAVPAAAPEPRWPQRGSKTPRKAVVLLGILGAVAVVSLLAAAILVFVVWRPFDPPAGGSMITPTRTPDVLSQTQAASEVADPTAGEPGADHTPAATPPDPAAPQNPIDLALLQLVPAGSFLMGSEPAIDPFFWGAEYPQRSVVIDYDYYIYHTEVTNQMYQDCVLDGDCLSPALTGSMTRTSYYNDARFVDYPVINVTWAMAQSYCEWAGGRLPTEAEWEKAARGEDGRLFPWGNQPADASRVNYCDRNCPAPEGYDDDDGYADTAPVGSFPTNASSYGALDMSGNVMEWVNDWFDPYYYQSAPNLNPPGPESGDNGRRVARGGSFYQSVAAMRAVGRTPRNPDIPADFIGFRCVLEERP